MDGSTFTEIETLTRTRQALKTGSALAKFHAASVRNVDIARAFKVTPDQVSRWLNGHVMPNNPNTLRIAQLLSEIDAITGEFSVPQGH